MNKLSKIDIAYMAGIVDGEGSITAYVTQRTRIRLTVTNTSLELMKWMVSRFGGSFYTKAKKEERNMQAYGWEVACKKAEKALRLLLPFLVIKKRQAELALQIQDTITIKRSTVTPEIKVFRRWAVKQISKMNTGK